MPLSVQKPPNPGGGENMVSNLPLLFAAGYPTSLEKINASQLEKFIPFMVQCSLGQIQITNMADCSEPEWWPEDVKFSIPLQKPPQYPGVTWLAKLKEIVAICYRFHKSVFLLRFCENLSAYQPENLRFINNFNSTTSLFDRISNKLLVTFRNENMLYDQIPMNSKKTLLPRTHSSQTIESNQESMVEHAPFDIYLCDNCEAELYSLEAYKEHEKYCQGGIESEDDDVMIIEQEDEPTMQQACFLQNFQLVGASTTREQKMSAESHHHNNNNNNLSINNNAVRDIPSAADKKLKRVPRRTHMTLTLSKCPMIPFSSPAGRHLIKTANGQITTEYQLERIERVERSCVAPALAYDGSNRPKFLDKKIMTSVPITYRKSNAPNRYYCFPRRQLSQKSRQEAIKTLQSILLRETRCRPLRIPLKRLSEEDIEKLINDARAACKRMPPAKLARRTNVIDIIDLCTSDEEPAIEDADEVEEVDEFDTVDEVDDLEGEGYEEYEEEDEYEEAETITDEPNEARTPDSNGTKENINHNPWNNNVQITKGNKSLDLNALRKSINDRVGPSSCDSNSSQFGSDAIQNLLTNRQSISLIKNRPLQHQNQEHNSTRYLNVRVNDPVEHLLFGRNVPNNEITITKKSSAVVPATNTMQTNNFISIDLTL